MQATRSEQEETRTAGQCIPIHPIPAPPAIAVRLTSIIFILQLDSSRHPPGSADTRMAKRVKMIFVSLLEHILFSLFFFLFSSLFSPFS